MLTPTPIPNTLGTIISNPDVMTYQKKGHDFFKILHILYPKSCAQNHLDTQECVFYTSLRKKEILINYNYQ